MKISLNTVSQTNSISTINSNFTKLAEELQDKVLYRNNPIGEPNEVESDLDMNGNSLYNAEIIQTSSLTVDGKDVSVNAINEAVAATAADRVQTGKDSISSGLNATAASASAADAKVSAEQAKLVSDGWETISTSLGYEVPIAYTAGIVLTRPTQTVEYQNVIYSTYLSSLPLTTSGVFEIDDLRVIQDSSQRVSVAVFGASPSNTAAVNNVAFQKAFLSKHTVFIPAGKYFLSTTLYRDNGLIEGEGYSSELIFENMNGADGIVFSPTVGQTTSGCRDLAIYAKTSNGGSAIKTPYEAAQYTTYRSSFQYSGLLISGYTKPLPGANNAFETIESWNYGINQGDAWNVGIRECDCYGNYRSDQDFTTQFKSVFIRLHAENGMLTAHINSFTCSNVFRGVELGDRCFFHISNFDIAHSCDGVFQLGGSAEFTGNGVLKTFVIPSSEYGSSSPNPPPSASVTVKVDGIVKVENVDYTYTSAVVTFTVAPAVNADIVVIIGKPFGESKVIHGNINSQRYGIYFQDIGTREIIGVVVRRHKFGWKGATYDWAGIRLVNCTYVWITDCQIQPDISNGSWFGTSYGVQLIICGSVTALGTIIGANVDRGFLIDKTTMFNAEATQTFQNTATDVIFRAIRNSRLSRIGSFVKVSTFSGIEYSDDGSITPGAIQQYQRNVIPEGGTPTYMYRRSSSGVDEKNWKTVVGATSWALQLADDANIANTNAIIVNRSGMTTTSVDVRTPQLKLNNGPTMNVGAGSPEGVLVANIGSVYLRTNGSTATTFYVKESNTGGNTGWIAK